MINLVPWLAIIVLFAKPMWRAAWGKGATKLDSVLAVVWWLALNRVCFISASALGRDPVALSLCYVFAFGGACAMIGIGSAALRAQSRDG